MRSLSGASYGLILRGPYLVEKDHSKVSGRWQVSGKFRQLSSKNFAGSHKKGGEVTEAIPHGLHITGKVQVCIPR